MSADRGVLPVVPDLEALLALALSRPQEALATARTLLAGRAPPQVAAVAHQAAGIVLRDFGDIDEALAEFRAAIRCAGRTGDDERAADAGAAYGVALVMAGRSRAGLTQIEAAADGAVGQAAGRIRIREAHALWVLGRHAEMLRAAQRAVSELEGGPDPVWQARAYNHRAMASLALGAVARADADYARAEELFARAGQRLEFASARHDRGAAAFTRGDLPSALALLDDARRVVDELGVFEPELEVTRVRVLLAAQLNRDALRVADEAVARGERLRGAATRRGELLFAAALAASAAGNPATAVARSAQALRMFRRQQRAWWAVRAELVLLESRFVAGERSPAMLRRTVELAGLLDGVDRDRAVETRLLAGRLALALGRTETGRLQLRAAAARRPRDLRARTAGWLARAVLAEAEGRSHDLLAACARGLDLLDAHLGTLGATELRARATAQGGELARVALRHAVRTGDAARLLEWSERWRATALTVPPVRLPADTELTRALTALRAASARRPQQLVSGRAMAGEHERRRLEDAVRRESLHRPGRGPAGARPAGARSVGGGRRPDTGALRSLLGDAVLVELTDVDGQLYAVVVDAAHAPEMVRVGPTAVADRSLAHALFALRRHGTRRGETPLDLGPIGERLQQALLGPAMDIVCSRRGLGGGRIVVVPTGRLHAVPWALLPDLAERAVTVAPSAATWARARQAAPAAGGRVVLVGGPNLSTGVSEVRRLADRYPDAVVLAEGEATCERVLAAMDGAWLVHVAAHGTFRDDSPLLSALELDDGPLTVYDLERLDRAPHRVVLSSCSSAVGVPSGADELLGVVSALMALGSVGVVASVVPVDDPGTVMFMLALHQHLAEAPLGEALLRARRSVRDDATARRAGESFIALGA